MPTETKRVVRELKSLGGEMLFPRLHHFADARFRTRPSSYRKHWDYCDIRTSFRAGNNVQTRHRIQEAVDLRKSGIGWKEAIRRAWQQFPAI